MTAFKFRIWRAGQYLLVPQMCFHGLLSGRNGQTMRGYALHKPSCFGTPSNLHPARLTLLPADYVVEQCRQDVVANVQQGHSKNGH